MTARSQTLSKGDKGKEEGYEMFSMHRLRRNTLKYVVWVLRGHNCGNESSLTEKCFNGPINALTSRH